MSSIQQKRDKKVILAQALILAGLLLAASAVGYFFKWAGFQESNIVMVYILAVLLTSRLTDGYWYGIISGVLATVMFNYFFTEPVFTFKYYNSDYLITFVIMTAAALLTSAMTSRAKQDEELAARGEEEARSIYKLTNRLTEVADMETMKKMIQSAAGRVLGCEVICRSYEPGTESLNDSGAEAASRNGVRTADTETDGTGGEEDDGEEDGQGIENMEQEESRLAKHTVKLPDGREYAQRAIHGQHGIQAVLLIPLEKAVSMDETQERQIAAMLDSTGLAMERLKFHDERVKNREEMERERYRSRLLHTASDGLKTPLLDIMALSEKLMKAEAQGDEKYRMAEEIHRDARWLHSLVWNILSLNRLQEGRPRVEKREVELQAVIKLAAKRTQEQYPESRLRLALPEEGLMIQADRMLQQQAFLNLLENAVKHAAGGAVTVVEAVPLKEEKSVRVTVSGCSSAENRPDGENMKELAEKECRLKLTICEMILKAHGGELSFGEDGLAAVLLPVE